jgi:hypothetical protein
MSDESPVDTPDNQQDLDQVDPEEAATSSTESNESVPDKNESCVDQEMADEYGFTPQQAKAMGLYL